MIKTVKDPEGRKFEIKIDDDLDWLTPYLLQSRKLGVPIWRIEAIKGYFVPKNKTEAQKAQILMAPNGKKFTITLLKKYQYIEAKAGKLKVTRYRDADCRHKFEETLSSFAHELAHAVIWEHNADRYILENRMLLSFSRLAKQLGYKGY